MSGGELPESDHDYLVSCQALDGAEDVEGLNAAIGG